MKMKLCRCLWSGLIRPTDGPIKIKQTRVLAPDVLVARLGGKENAKVHVVELGGKFYFKGPKSMGGITEVPADHLVDAVNYRVWEMNKELAPKSATKKSAASRKPAVLKRKAR